MPRAKRGFKRRRRVKKVLDKAEGFDFRRKNTFRRAYEAVVKAHVYAYRDRRRKKREFRGLWIERMNGALQGLDMNYSRFICALKKSNVLLNRKWLSEIAIHDPKGFEAIVTTVRGNAPAF
jgi:large subunit ribosomal protein L20